MVARITLELDDKTGGGLEKVAKGFDFAAAAAGKLEKEAESARNRLKELEQAQIKGGGTGGVGPTPADIQRQKQIVADTERQQAIHQMIADLERHRHAVAHGNELQSINSVAKLERLQQQILATVRASGRAGVAGEEERKQALQGLLRIEQRIQQVKNPPAKTGGGVAKGMADVVAGGFAAIQALKGVAQGISYLADQGNPAMIRIVGSVDALKAGLVEMADSPAVQDFTDRLSFAFSDAVKGMGGAGGMLDGMLTKFTNISDTIGLIIAEAAGAGDEYLEDYARRDEILESRRKEADEAARSLGVQKTLAEFEKEKAAAADAESFKKIDSLEGVAKRQEKIIEQMNASRAVGKEADEERKLALQQLMQLEGRAVEIRAEETQRQIEQNKKVADSWNELGKQKRDADRVAKYAAPEDQAFMKKRFDEEHSAGIDRAADDPFVGREAALKDIEARRHAEATAAAEQLESLKARLESEKEITRQETEDIRATMRDLKEKGKLRKSQEDEFQKKIEANKAKVKKLDKEIADAELNAADTVEERRAARQRARMTAEATEHAEKMRQIEEERDARDKANAKRDEENQKIQAIMSNLLHGQGQGQGQPAAGGPPGHWGGGPGAFGGGAAGGGGMPGGMPFGGAGGAGGDMAGDGGIPFGGGGPVGGPAPGGQQPMPQQRPLSAQQKVQALRAARRAKQQANQQRLAQLRAARQHQKRLAQQVANRRMDDVNKSDRVKKLVQDNAKPGADKQALNRKYNRIKANVRSKAGSDVKHGRLTPSEREGAELDIQEQDLERRKAAKQIDENVYKIKKEEIEEARRQRKAMDALKAESEQLLSDEELAAGGGPKQPKKKPNGKGFSSVGRNSQMPGAGGAGGQKKQGWHLLSDEELQAAAERDTQVHNVTLEKRAKDETLPEKDRESAKEALRLSKDKKWLKQFIDYYAQHLKRKQREEVREGGGSPTNADFDVLAEQEFADQNQEAKLDIEENNGSPEEIELLKKEQEQLANDPEFRKKILADIKKSIRDEHNKNKPKRPPGKGFSSVGRGSQLPGADGPAPKQPDVQVPPPHNAPAEPPPSDDEDEPEDEQSVDRDPTIGIRAMIENDDLDPAELAAKKAKERMRRENTPRSKKPDRHKTREEWMDDIDREIDAGGAPFGGGSDQVGGGAGNDEIAWSGSGSRADVPEGIGQTNRPPPPNNGAEGVAPAGGNNLADSQASLQEALSANAQANGEALAKAATIAQKTAEIVQQHTTALQQMSEKLDGLDQLVSSLGNGSRKQAQRSVA
jgi:hypothetical protein